MNGSQHPAAAAIDFDKDVADGTHGVTGPDALPGDTAFTLTNIMWNWRKADVELSRMLVRSRSSSLIAPVTHPLCWFFDAAFKPRSDAATASTGKETYGSSGQFSECQTHSPAVSPTTGSQVRSLPVIRL
jgi:hypothetical protein